MDKETVKLLLQSYRPADADDPIFREALREVASDPALAAWFAEEQRFDALMTAKLGETLVPGDLKQKIMENVRPKAPVHRLVFPAQARFWAWGGAIAAAVVLLLWLNHSAVPAVEAAQPLELEAISYTEKMPPLQFVCFNATAVADWVNRQPGAKKVNLRLPSPDKGMSMAMIGSSMLDWHGHPVVMICLQNKSRMAMLYIMNASDAPSVPEGDETVEKQGWVVRTTKADGQIHILTAKGTRHDLNFPMPF